MLPMIMYLSSPQMIFYPFHPTRRRSLDEEGIRKHVHKLCNQG